jgi:hypothetical protein
MMFLFRFQPLTPGRYKTQVAGCRLEFRRLGILKVGILQVGDFAGWNFAGCQEFCRLMMQTENYTTIKYSSII